MSKIMCPLVDKEIQDIDCVENSDIANGMFKESNLPDIYKVKKNWREICQNCKNNRD